MATQKGKSTHNLFLLLQPPLLLFLLLPLFLLLLLGLGSRLSTRREALLLRFTGLLLLLLDALDTGVGREGEVDETADLGDVLLLAACTFSFVLLFGVALVVATF